MRVVVVRTRTIVIPALPAELRRPDAALPDAPGYPGCPGWLNTNLHDPRALLVAYGVAATLDAPHIKATPLGVPA